MLSSILRPLATIATRRLYASTAAAATSGVSPDAPKTGIEKYRSQLLYQSIKRGILENDIILGGFARQYLPTLTQGELEAYDKIINGGYVEWDLFYYCIDKKPPPPELAGCAVFQKLLSYVQSLKPIEQ
uniref:Succinate dehydrogenase assembly factor 2, mitochondrial n=1 Tax=Panagrellus redivivus TaxID=6233 RepID=A0A7E4WCZ4_PANRE